jgi:ArsR family transcriptional regulator
MTTIVDFYKALSDETRLKIIKMLIGRELCACEIIEKLDLAQPTISHHLKILKYAGLINDKKDGKWVFYTLNVSNFLSLQSSAEQEIFAQIAHASENPIKTSPARNETKCI